ncbi:MAG: GNAT family protein [Polyangiaceae bacterium]
MQEKAITLVGKAVSLIPFELGHLSALGEVAKDEEVWRHLSTSLATDDLLRAFGEHAVRERESGNALPFTIVESATGRFVGCTRYFDLKPEHRNLEIGYTWLARSVWRTRVNTECKFLLLEHAFEERGCIRVQLCTDVKNERSRKAIGRLGAQQEGILRQHRIVRGGVLRDSVFFSILDREWPEVKTRLAAMLTG